MQEWVRDRDSELSSKQVAYFTMENLHDIKAFKLHWEYNLHRTLITQYLNVESPL